MTDYMALQGQSRLERGRRENKKLRAAALLPAVVYGNGMKAQALSLDVHQFTKVYRSAGESTIINLIVDEQMPLKVLIQDIQRDPLSNAIAHVDFHQVRMDQKINAEIELDFVGESAAVREQGGILVKNLTHLEVECLPADLPHEIKVDISKLAIFDDIIRVSDLILPPNVATTLEKEITVVSVEPPRSEEELKALEGTVVEDVTTVEAAKEKKPTKEEAAEDQQNNTKNESAPAEKQAGKK